MVRMAERQCLHRRFQPGDDIERSLMHGIHGPKRHLRLRFGEELPSSSMAGHFVEDSMN